MSNPLSNVREKPDPKLEAASIQYLPEFFNAAEDNYQAEPVEKR
jgi:hypothetical protein